MDMQAHLAKLQYERSVAASQQGGGATGLDAAGPPYWDRQSWETWKATYGEYPFSAHHLPSTFEGAPDWVWELMQLRKPPVIPGNLGSAGANTAAVDRATVWGIK